MSDSKIRWAIKVFGVAVYIGFLLIAMSIMVQAGERFIESLDWNYAVFTFFGFVFSGVIIIAGWAVLGRMFDE